MAARFDQQWQRAEELLQLLCRFSLRLPRGATTAATHTPWNDALAPRQLDYILTNLKHSDCESEETLDEAILATSHRAVLVAAPDVDAAAQASLARPKWQRRRWPHWREVPGQLAAILPTSTA